MAGQLGRECLVKVDVGGAVFTAIPGLLTKELSISNSELDITTDDDAGAKTLLPGKFGIGASVSVSGVILDDNTYGTIRGFALAGTAHDVQIVIPGATSNGTYSFSAIFTEFSVTGEQADAVKFSATLVSSGAITFA
jgi:predicted secreted protein